MTPEEPSLEEIARLIPRDHTRALIMLFSAVGVALGSAAFLMLASHARAAAALPAMPGVASAPLVCSESARPRGEEKPAAPTFDGLLAQGLEHDLEALDVSACAQPGGPVGPGRVNLRFSNDGSVETSEIDSLARQGAFAARFSDSPAVARCIQSVYAKAHIAPFVGEANNRMVRVAFVVPARDTPFDEDAAARTLDGVDLSACRVPGVVLRGVAQIVLLPDGRLRADDVSAQIAAPRGAELPRDAAKRTDEASRCVTRAYGRARGARFSGTEIVTAWWFEVRDPGR